MAGRETPATRALAAAGVAFELRGRRHEADGQRAVEVDDEGLEHGVGVEAERVGGL